MSLPNIMSIFNMVRQLPIKPEHLKMIYTAWSMFKGKDLKGTPDEIERVLAQLNMSRADIVKALPLLEKPFIRDALERVMPDSTDKVKALANHIVNNDEYNQYDSKPYPQGNKGKGANNKEIPVRFPL